MLPRPRHNFIPVFLLLLALCWSAGAQQVILQLKNGDRLTGKIVLETTNQVAFTTIWSNNIAIPVDWITNRQTIALLAATNAVAPTNVVVIAPPAKPIPPPAPVVLIPKKPQLWHYEAQVGVNLQYNQQTSQLYFGMFKTVFTGDRWRHTMDLRANYGKTDQTVSANNLYSTWRVEHDVDKAKRTFVFNAMGSGYDQLRQIHFTYDESIGAGYKFIERPNFTFTGDSGANYQKQYFYHYVFQPPQPEPPTAPDSFALRVAEVMTWKINPRLSWDEKFEFYPRLTSWSDYRFRAESNLAYKLNSSGSLFLTLGIVDLYDTEPAANVSRNDLAVHSALALKF